MTTITAELVKTLRDRTSAAMMDCKKALVEAAGDIEKAAKILRENGAAKADKKSGRVTAEGSVAIAGDKQKALVEVNCETDFVSRDDNFKSFVQKAAETALKNNVKDVAQLADLKIVGGSETIEEARQALIAKIGENIQLRRIALSQPSAVLASGYIHSGRIGVLVELDVNNDDLGRDIAMHIAASKPVVVSPENVSQELVAKEKDIYMAQAAQSGKPQDIIEKMVAGRLKKFLDEVSLVGQPFVKDPDTTVGALLAKHKAKVLGFHRFEVGEGIEKIVEDFKEAVMAQIQGS